MRYDADMVLTINVVLWQVTRRRQVGQMQLRGQVGQVLNEAELIAAYQRELEKKYTGVGLSRGKDSQPNLKLRSYCPPLSEAGNKSENSKCGRLAAHLVRCGVSLEEFQV